MAYFRFAHISDLHFAREADRPRPLVQHVVDRKSSATASINTWIDAKSYGLKRRLISPPSHSSDLARSLADALRNYHATKPFDFILATGDLATTGQREDLTVAKDFLFSEAENSLDSWRRGKLISSLANLDVDIYLLPGNHDRYQGKKKLYFPANKEFDTIFSDQWKSRRGVSGWLVEKRGGGEKLAIYLADFSLKYSADATLRYQGGIWGQGRAYQITLNYLQFLTRQSKENGYPVIWAMHFAPEFPNIRENLKLLGENEVISAAKSVDVEYIFCGHTHHQDAYESKLVDGVNVICSGSSTECTFPPAHIGNSVQVISLEVDGNKIVAAPHDEIKCSEYGVYEI